MSDASSDRLRTGGGRRQRWEDLPRHIRDAIADRAGSPVVEVISQAGGFSPGLAAVVRTGGASGGDLFIKAVSSDLNADAPRMHRREAIIAAALPASAPVSRLLWVIDEGEPGWVVLAFAALDGASPTLPWQPETLATVIEALDDLSERLTPSPIPEAVAGRMTGTGSPRVGWWRSLRDDPPAGLDPWSRRHLDELVLLERDVHGAVRGETLLHCDLRADNMLVVDGQVVIVDWPHARIGAPWLDIAFMAPSVAMQGGPAPGRLFGRSRVGRAADPAGVRCAVADIAGFFTAQSLRPPVPGLPTLRRFQADQGVEARRWLAQLAGLSPDDVT